jgi:hypothetical protein
MTTNQQELFKESQFYNINTFKMVKPKKLKKCRYCGKVLRSYNKSSICSSCRNAYRFELEKKVIDDVEVL